jgi:hypothetical protein
MHAHMHANEHGCMLIFIDAICMVIFMHEWIHGDIHASMHICIVIFSADLGLPSTII